MTRTIPTTTVFQTMWTAVAALHRTKPARLVPRFLHTALDFHAMADTTLGRIQDSLDVVLDEEDMEVEYSSGVLTIQLPPHGTWVLNKQSPNQQIWWSSPLSGPRRYEWNERYDRWVSTRSEEGDSLGEALAKEIKELYHVDLPLKGL